MTTNFVLILGCVDFTHHSVPLHTDDEMEDFCHRLRDMKIDCWKDRRVSQAESERHKEVYRRSQSSNCTRPSRKERCHRLSYRPGRVLKRVARVRRHRFPAYKAVHRKRVQTELQGQILWIVSPSNPDA